MTDTLFADVSSYQPDVDNRYPYHFLSIRSNDGTYRDSHFGFNLAWAKHAVDIGRMTGFLVYFVYEPNWSETVGTFKAMVGTPHPRMAVMIDAETWGGKISGNQSAGLNATRESLIAWLHGNRKRVLGYANAGDFASMWPTRGDIRVVLANYSSNPPFPGKIAHQFASNFNVPPFGPCDINSADGLSPVQFAAALGLGVVPVPIPKPVPIPIPKPIPTPIPAPIPPEDDDMILVATAASDWPAGGPPNPGIFLLANNTVKHVSHMSDVAAYKAAGVKGPIAISKDEFLHYPDVTVKATP